MTKSVIAVCVCLAVIAAVGVRVSTQGTEVADVAAITKIENDVVKADLANDAAFYTSVLAADWTGGTSRGTWDTKPSMLADMKDTANNKTSSETVTNIKVRVHGDVAVATYTTAYDAMIQGQHYARTVISTDTFQKQSGAWKLLAGHSSTAK
jgi:ketosteroid isomerase-like protein